MQIVNLDPTFKAEGLDTYQNVVTKSVFPGGEPHIKIDTSLLERGNNAIIIHRVNNMTDLVEILLANDALQRLGFREIYLIMPYLPAARQDRVCVEGEALTSKVIAGMINSCGFEGVTALTPHSDVMPALINNFQATDVDASYIGNIFDSWELDNDAIINVVSPDAGAMKRTLSICSKLTNEGFNINLVKGDKIRDVKTGSLSGFEVHADDLGGRHTIIVDDINCRGGTFLGLGEVLRQKNCGKLFLYTTHSDCVEGIVNVASKFDGVYTTNSKQNWDEHELVKDLPNVAILALDLIP